MVTKRESWLKRGPVFVVVAWWWRGGVAWWSRKNCINLKDNSSVEPLWVVEWLTSLSLFLMGAGSIPGDSIL